jgi:hypothetical protein
MVKATHQDLLPIGNNSIKTGIVSLKNYRKETMKWTGTILCLIGIALTSLNIFPFNLWFGFIGSGLWAYAGLRDKDFALFVVEIVAVLMYVGGLIKLFVV